MESRSLMTGFFASIEMPNIAPENGYSLASFQVVLSSIYA